MFYFAKGKSKKQMQAELKKSLILEQDYELATLHQAIRENDDKEKERSKARLAEINKELGELA